jgi:cytochrome P450
VVRPGAAQIDGEDIPSGTFVGTGLYALHHNPSYFRQPFKFAPEQWIPSEENPQESIDAASKAFAPFLIGARMCAARNMAMAELLLSVAQIMYSMEFRIADGPEGTVGEGRLGMGVGREREEEFQLYSHFVTVGKEGPVLQFRKRVD